MTNTTANDTIEKAQKIAAEAVGQARGAAPALLDTVEDWIEEAKGSISKYPLLVAIAAGALGFVVATTWRRR